MLGKSPRLFLISMLLGTALAVSAAAQDFQKSYQLTSGGSIRISTVSGDVTVTGYDGKAVVVTGTKQGPNIDMVEIVDHSGGNSVDVSVSYPQNCRNCNASVDFQVQVPRSIKYNFGGIRSISGEVNVTGVSGRLDASTVSGGVSVTDVVGSVSAKSVSGEVQVELAGLDGADDMSFSTVSGGVTVKLPAGLDAQVEMATFSGSIDTNFPIQIEKEQFTSSQKASGQLGSGSRRLRMSTVSGNLSLRQL
jgi:hypothetical protein